MPNKIAVFALTLNRDGISLPWGFRLSGGCDLDCPLVVTKVIVGSPSDGVLQKGDVIRKIANYDARDLRHSDALNLFKNAGGSVPVVIEREVPYSPIENHQSRNALPFIPQPPIPGAVATPFTVAGLPHYEGTQQHPRNNLCRFPPSLIEPQRSDSRLMNSSPHRLEVEQEQELVNEQPYRTNPLVLPGAKATKDPAPTMSYLRHHPNPMMRSSPSHYEWIPIDIAKKQQLADTILEKNIGNDKPNRKIVTKPYNTPIGLYSEQNIANTLNAQTGGFTPNRRVVVYNPPKNTRLRKTVVYDPSKSETFKALQEAEIGNHVQEVYTSPTPRVFSPTKTPNKLAPPTSYNYNPNRASPQPHPTAPHSKNFNKTAKFNSNVAFFV
ncbi:PDZ and LIM domain protein 3 isoform X2 [Planococcus citri]|uniref:PDZ and LIM domain protein 3 isoform X2 n=1 Tax=Planococcus citri TaxID=170843 RepID=UPI0031F9B419